MPLDQATREQILRWVADSNAGPILTLLDTMKDQRDRAEFQTAAYLHQIRELSKRTKAILDPLLGEPRGEPKPTTPLKPKATNSKPKSDLDIDITL